MKPDKIKRMLDACYLAKRIRELLPELPDGVAPAYIQYIDVIHHLLETNDCVKISDISDWLNLPRPGVTRTVKEMEAKGYLKKTTSQEDARITYITVTDKGEIRFYTGKYIREADSFYDAYTWGVNTTGGIWCS